MSLVEQVDIPILIEETLYAWQAEFGGIEGDGQIIEIPQFNFGKCGTKSGKTAGCALMLFLRMVNLPGTRWLWTAGVNKQLEPTWERYFRPLISAIPRGMRRVRDAYGMWKVELRPTGSMIILKSGDEPWNLRSDAFNGAVIDEAALYPLESYYSVMTNLTETAGILWAISTPKAAPRRAGSSWFDSGFAEGMKQEAAGLLIGDPLRTHRSFRVPTWSNPNPNIQKWVAMVRRMAEEGVLPGGMTHFNREYAAIDSDGESAVFRHVAKLHSGEPEEPQENAVYAMGWDPAARRDGSVVSIWRVDQRREVHIEYMLGVGIEAQYERVEHLWNKYRKPNGNFDATSFGGELVMTELRKRNIYGLKPIVFTNHLKTQFVQTMSGAMEREEPTFLNHAIARGEMEAFGYEVLPSGLIRYGAPQGQRDDTVSARMLAWMEVATGGIQVF